MDAVALGPLVRTDLIRGVVVSRSFDLHTQNSDCFPEGKTCLCFRLQSTEGSDDPPRS